MNRVRGFTVIELLIVIAIVGIIASLIIANVTRNNPKVTPIPTPTPGPRLPERTSAQTEVHLVPLGGLTRTSEKVHETLVTWSKNNPTLKIVSVVRCADENLVIVAETR